MKYIFKILDSKIFLLAIIAAIVFAFIQVRGCDQSEHDKKLETYKRQLDGQLTAKEQELQEANHELGVLKSKLVSQKELSKQQLEEKDDEFEAFKKEHNLKIKSKDRTIASLKQKVSGESTVTIVSSDADCQDINHCIISYNWEDTLKRFRLRDPNIFEPGNETFESEQLFKIYGEVYEQEDGSLQTRRLVLREVFQSEDGSYEPIPDAKADIIESDFQYHNPPTIDPEWNWTDLFRLRGIAVAAVTAFPDGGNTTLGLGLEFFSWNGLGINSHTSLDFENPEKIAQHIGIAYNPTIFDTELNLGVEVSIGTPFASFFQAYMVNVGLIFYLNN